MKNRLRLGRRSDKEWGWGQALALYAGAQAATFGLEYALKRAQDRKPGRYDDKMLYMQLKEPRFAPPSWLFAPAWTCNGISLLYGLVRVHNLPVRTPGRKGFLGLQTAFWLLYVAFTPLFFGLRSPLLGALVTNACLAVTAASETLALRRLKDGPAALSQLSTLLWLLIASATANATALWNRDPLFGTPAPQTPLPAWLKPMPAREPVKA